MTTLPDDPLQLQAWRVDVTPPERFASEVWQRIAARAPQRQESWWERFVFALPRPAWAGALVTASIICGLGLGHLAAANARSSALENGQARYMASINPLVHASR